MEASEEAVSVAAEQEEAGSLDPQYLYVLLWVVAAIWVFSLGYNLYYFLSTENTRLDSIFFNKAKSFEEALQDLAALEEEMSRQFNFARDKINFYYKNAKQTKREYKYYSSYVEGGFVKLYLGETSTKLEVINKLDPTVKIHFLFILFCTVLAGIIGFICFVLVGFSSFNLSLIAAGIFLALLFVHFFRNIIYINYLLFFILVDVVLIIVGKERGKLYRNLGIIEFLTRKWSGSVSGGVVVGASGVTGFSGGSGGFGGFGGGSFGGGGAGGSW